MRFNSSITAAPDGSSTADAHQHRQDVHRREDGPKSKKTLSGKTINNVLTCLRRMLVVARKRGLIEFVPDVEWLKRDHVEFDFLDFDEAERLLKAAQGEWRTMILTALRTGMRHG